jgi:hypothetical protein
MNKPLMDYVREKDQCNYADIYDYFKDLGQCDSDLQARYLIELFLFIHEKEQTE